MLGPTGNSANLVNGRTLHSFLAVPCGAKANKDMTVPEGQKALRLQENCERLKCLMIDERSLVGCKVMGWAEFNLGFGMKCQDPWGNIPVCILLGDDIQLPPVLDFPVYLVSENPKPAAMRGSLVFMEFTEVIELVEIVRQDASEAEFRAVLGAMRTYSSTEEHTAWLQKFQWSNLLSRYGPEAMKSFEDNALYAFPTHEAEWEHNKSKLLEINTRHPIAKIKALCQGRHAQSSSADSSGGLVRTLYLCKEARVSLVYNMNVEWGLFNRSVGKIVDIVYLNGRKPLDGGFPDIVIVDFPSYTGPPLLDEFPTWVPLLPKEIRQDCLCSGCKRTQIPLRLGFGCTIHSTQGTTISTSGLNKQIVIDPGSTSFESRNPGATYVAFSRAKTSGDATTLPGFAVHPKVLLNHDRVCHKPKKSKLLAARSVHVKRLRKLASNTLIRFSH